MVENTKRKEKLTKKIEENKEVENEILILDSISAEISTFELMRVEDIEKADRIKSIQKIKGVERTARIAERPVRETISRFENKYYDAGDFDPTFMQRHTSEISYDLLRDELIKYGAITDLVAEVNSGKEASIYVAHLKGAPLIVKMFRLQLTSHNKAKRRRAGNPQTRATSFASTEYTKLSLAFQANVRVPTPALKVNNIILMSFIGENWIPAKQLRNVILEEPIEVFDEIVEQLKIMYQKAHLIHGDFSEYNILFHDSQPFIIDFPQAIDMRLLSNRSELGYKRNLPILRKDIDTICKYFEKEYKLEIDYEEIFRYVAGKDSMRENVDFTIDEIEELIRLQQMTVSTSKIKDKDLIPENR
ncbi:MAG: hypothetical protein EAX90_09045 [Candidatus Heimdallarchaeota archaeon]|nr:hypothetical protein [Candidatus Heimdallarchaeota archaeon]